MATGVSGERPPRSRASLHCREVVMPMYKTSVPGKRASDS